MQSDHGGDRVDDESHRVRDALIIAAGKGSRLAGRGDLKPLIPVLDEPLIERVIGAGIEAGLRRFWIVTGYRHQELGLFLNDLRRRLGVWIEELYNDNWQGSDGISVLFDALESVVDESGDASLSDGVRWLGTRRRAGVHDIGESFWMDVDDGAMLDLAEQLMSGRS